ncbi:hypothetical protein RQP46_009060 [Phenoliferia psychrophenolica]
MSELHPAPTSPSLTKQDSELATPAPHPPAQIGLGVLTQLGVLKVEVAQRVCYVYSLDGTTTYQYQAYATSSFDAHSTLGAIVTAQAIVLALCKPVAAKLSDVVGRAETYSLAALFYVLGYILLASCSTIGTYSGGAILYEVGYAAVQILQQLVIGDVTSLRWRSLLSNVVSIPFFVNAMFAIIMPAAIAPIVATLFWAQHRAKKLGVEATNYRDDKTDKVLSVKDRVSLVQRVRTHLIDLDAFGLLLFAAGWACVLLPLTLVNNDHTTWHSHSVIAMLVCGGVILIAFVVFEAKVAIKPLFPLHFFGNVTILFSALIGFFDFVSFCAVFPGCPRARGSLTTQPYQYSFIYVTHPDWSIKDQGYFAYTQTLCLTLFALIAGFIQAYTRRTKWLLVFGVCVRLLGVGLMIKSRGAHGSTFFLVITQVIQGMGGGIAATSCQLLAQEMGTATAFVLLFAEIGNAVGSAVRYQTHGEAGIAAHVASQIAAAVWRSHMPHQLTSHLTGLLNSTEIDSIYNSITTAISYPLDGPIYHGIIESYDATMKTLLIAATCVAVVPVFLSLFMKDMYLSDAHNAIEGEDVRGLPLGVVEESVEESEERKAREDRAGVQELANLRVMWPFGQSKKAAQPDVDSSIPRFVGPGRLNFDEAGLPEYGGPNGGCFAIVIDNLFSPEELSRFLAAAEASAPWDVARVNATAEISFVDTSYRNGDRIIFDSFEISQEIFDRHARLMHTGEQVISGTKVTVRSDILYEDV